MHSGAPLTGFDDKEVLTLVPNMVNPLWAHEIRDHTSEVQGRDVIIVRQGSEDHQIQISKDMDWRGFNGKLLAVMGLPVEKIQG